MKVEGMTVDEILQRVADKDITVEQAVEEEVRCDCGRITTKELLMTASFGKACPECYDEKS